jgi:hypothetical protein
MLLDEGSMSPLEYQVYCSLFIDKTYDWMNPKKMMYINTDPEVCFRRIKQRSDELLGKGLTSREGEQLITIEYLKSCAKQHDYLFEKAAIQPTCIDGNIEDEDVRRQTVNDIMIQFQQAPIISAEHIWGYPHKPINMNYEFTETSTETNAVDVEHNSNSTNNPFCTTQQSLQL